MTRFAPVTLNIYVHLFDADLDHRFDGLEAPRGEERGTTPVIFPSDHRGFLGGEYGQTRDPDAFAPTLREVPSVEA